MKGEKWKAAEEKEASLVASAGGAACKSRCKSPSKSARAVYDNAVFTADVHLDPSAPPALPPLKSTAAPVGNIGAQ